MVHVCKLPLLQPTSDLLLYVLQIISSYSMH